MYKAKIGYILLAASEGAHGEEAKILADAWCDMARNNEELSKGLTMQDRIDQLFIASLDRSSVFHSRYSMHTGVVHTLDNGITITDREMGRLSIEIDGKIIGFSANQSVYEALDKRIDKYYSSLTDDALNRINGMN